MSEEAARPRVLLYAHRLAAPAATGLGRAAVELCRALGTLTPAPPFDVDVLSLRECEAEASEFGKVRVLRADAARRPVQVAWCVAGAPAVDGRRLGGRCQLVHALHPTTPVPSRAPVIYTVHDLMTLHHPGWYRGPERWAYGRAFRDVRRRAAHVITDSEWVAAQVREELGVPQDRVSVVPCGVSPRFREPVPVSDVERVCRSYGTAAGRYALALGAVSARKNLLPVVRAVAAMPPGARPDLLVAGPAGRGSERVVEEIGRLGVEGSVRLVGYVPDADLPALVAGALALVQPSLDEGFGLPPLEAMAAGVPAIVSRSGALPEVTGDAALVVDAGDVDGWRAALEEVRDDSGRRQTLVARGRERAKRYTWEEAARRTVSIYAEVLKESPAGRT